MLHPDLIATGLTLKLAVITTILLLIIATPLAWWLAFTSSSAKIWVTSAVALPLVLPPTVLGFYLLVFMGPQGWMGQVTQYLGWGSFNFSFGGLVLASLVSSLPFAVQPIQNAFIAIGHQPLEAAATLRAAPWDRFFSIALPQAKPGLVTAATLSFAHTLGEFGIVLMIGGGIPGETKVLSIAIYQHVEAGEYSQAHLLSGLLLAGSFLILMFMYRHHLSFLTRRTSLRHDNP